MKNKDSKTESHALYKMLAAGDSMTVGGFRIYLEDNETLKVTAVSVGSENIRVEPKSANCIVVHACS